MGVSRASEAMKRSGMPVRPIIPGSRNNGADFADMESMPVRSVLTCHPHGTRLPAGTRGISLFIVP